MQTFHFHETQVIGDTNDFRIKIMYLRKKHHNLYFYIILLELSKSRENKEITTKGKKKIMFSCLQIL